MPRTAYAVIGSWFGDEGKGRTVDYLASKVELPLVVRFQSGAQAGHTVQAGAKRHTFSHVGAGAFAGAPTYLADKFVCQPMMLGKELLELHALGLSPIVYVSPNALVTTPWDMWLNREFEEQRGSMRHGSVGIGFHQTLVRSTEPSLRLTVGDLFQKSSEEIQRLLWRIKQDAESKLRSYSAHVINPIARTNHRAMMHNFLKDIKGFVENVQIAYSLEFLKHFTLIFEGSQGLMLGEQTTEFFPHLTPAHTGLRDIADTLPHTRVNKLQVFYVTRTYITRHGAGPLSREGARFFPPGFVDDTNIPNDWQGTMRAAPLDIDWLERNVSADFQNFAQAHPHVEMTRHYSVTCGDQHGESAVPIVIGGDLEHRPLGNVYDLLHDLTEGHTMLRSGGPDRDQTVQLETAKLETVEA